MGHTENRTPRENNSTFLQKSHNSKRIQLSTIIKLSGNSLANIQTEKKGKSFDDE